MIEFDKGSVIRTNKGEVGIILGISETQLPDDVANMRYYYYDDFDSFLLNNLCVTFIYIMCAKIYDDEDEYMKSLTQKYLDIVIQNAAKNNLKGYYYELAKNKLFNSHLYTDKKVDITPFLNGSRKHEKFYSIHEVYTAYKAKTKDFFEAKGIAVDNWNKISPNNPVVKELRNGYLYFTAGKSQYTFYLYDKPSNSICRIERVDIRNKRDCDIVSSTQIGRNNKDWIELSDALRERLRETNMDMSFLWKYIV